MLVLRSLSADDELSNKEPCGRKPPNSTDYCSHPPCAIVHHSHRQGRRWQRKLLIVRGTAGWRSIVSVEWHSMAFIATRGTRTETLSNPHPAIPPRAAHVGGCRPSPRCGAVIRAPHDAPGAFRPSPSGARMPQSRRSTRPSAGEASVRRNRYGSAEELGIHIALEGVRRYCHSASPSALVAGRISGRAASAGHSTSIMVMTPPSRGVIPPPSTWFSRRPKNTP